jgi:hypothetical protein
LYAKTYLVFCFTGNQILVACPTITFRRAVIPGQKHRGLYSFNLSRVLSEDGHYQCRELSEGNHSACFDYTQKHLGESDLDDFLSKRDQINSRIRAIIKEQTGVPCGVRVILIEVKDVLHPETMKRAMAKEAEVKRDKRTKIIHVHGAQQASKTMAEAAEIMQSQPVSLQLRYLQTLVGMAGEMNSTIIPLNLDLVNTLSQVKFKGDHK